MNQPTEQRLTAIEQRLSKLEDVTADWQDWKAITRDSAHKIGVAEGLASTLQGDMIQVKADLARVSRQVATVIDHQIETKTEMDKRFGEMDKKLDLILQLLQPRQE